MTTQNRCVLAIDDVAKAFDNVPIDEVMSLHRLRITNDKLLRLIEVVLRGTPKRRG